MARDMGRLQRLQRCVLLKNHRATKAICGKGQHVKRANAISVHEQLKNMTQGTEITQSSIVEFVKLLHIPKEEKDKLIALTPEEYIGIAPKLIDIK